MANPLHEMKQQAAERAARDIRQAQAILAMTKWDYETAFRDASERPSYEDAQEEAAETLYWYKEQGYGQ